MSVHPAVPEPQGLGSEASRSDLPGPAHRAGGGPVPAPRLAVGGGGAGRVGSVLGAALARAGPRVGAAPAGSADPVRRAQRLPPGVAPLAARQVVRAADLGPGAGP